MKKFTASILAFLVLSALTAATGVFYDTRATLNSDLLAGYIYQDFENPVFPPAGWSVANSSGYNWVRTLVCSGYGSGSSSVKADFFDYPSGNFDLVSITLPATTAGDSLGFDHAYATFQTENDQLLISTSSNNGSSWNLLVTLNGGTGGPLVTAPPTQNCFVPTSTQWATKKYALPAGTNKIKFSGVTAYGNNLYIDNIRVGSPYTNDAGAVSITVPKGAITSGLIAPKATFRNFGSATQSFQVTLTINPGSYINTQSVSSLGAGQSQLVTFANFNFSSNGSYTLKATSSLGSDQNHVNDTISASVVVTPAPRNVVLEFCTGTWCPWCPCGDQQAEQLEVLYPNSVILAYHGGGGGDPFVNFNGNTIIGLLGLSAYPSGMLDRRGVLGWGSFCTDGENRLNLSPASTVNVVITNKTYNTGTRQLSVTLDATALQTLSGQYKINYVIAEDNVVYQQTGNSACTGGSNYVHKWIVRNMVNGAAGENVNSGGSWNNGQTYTKNFSTTLTAGWQEGNCKVHIFVYKDQSPLNTGEIQQGIKAPVLPVSVGNENNELPQKYGLSQNYPNPFNPVTNVKFAIPEAGDVSLKIYDVTGSLVAVYLDGFVKAGYYNAEIDGSNLSSGVYFYTLRAKDFVETKKMILVK
jgi:hypothetical protein